MRVQGTWVEPDKRIYWQFMCDCRPGICSPGGHHRVVHGGIPGYVNAAWCSFCNATGVRPEGVSTVLCATIPAGLAEGETYTYSGDHDSAEWPVPHPDHEQPTGTAVPGYRESWEKQFEPAASVVVEGASP
jgi:hypothetical protein